MDEFGFNELMNALDDDDESWFFMNTILPNTTHMRSTSSSTQEQDERPMSGVDYINDLLNKRPSVPYDYLRMNKTKFLALCEVILAKGIVKTDQVTIEEQIGMFLHIIGHASNMRSVSYNFQRSLDTVHRTFNDVLWSIIEMRNDYIKLPEADATRHASVREGTSFFPFKGALGAIDGTHIPAFVKEKKKKRRKYINRKNFVSQNVLAAVDFDMNFVYVSAGWEDSAADMKVLRAALDDGGFTVPQGKYYLADSGYANTDEEQEVTNDGEDDEDVEQSGVTTGLNETQLGDLLRTGIRNALWENMQNRNRNRRSHRN